MSRRKASSPRHMNWTPSTTTGTSKTGSPTAQIPQVALLTKVETGAGDTVGCKISRGVILSVSGALGVGRKVPIKTCCGGEVGEMVGTTASSSVVSCAIDDETNTRNTTRMPLRYWLKSIIVQIFLLFFRACHASCVSREARFVLRRHKIAWEAFGEWRVRFCFEKPISVDPPSNLPLLSFFGMKLVATYFLSPIFLECLSPKSCCSSDSRRVPLLPPPPVRNSQPCPHVSPKP